jgi:hypothetical protein
MFGIVWLRRGVLVDKDTSVLPSEADAIAAAESLAGFVAKSHPGREPDSFRLTDATGKILGVFPNLTAVRNLCCRAVVYAAAQWRIIPGKPLFRRHPCQTEG